MEELMQTNNEMSKKKYILYMSTIIFLGFLFVAISGILFQDPSFSEIQKNLNQPYISIIALIISIAGVVVQWYGAKIENISVALIGYLMISLTFGILIGSILQYYNLESIMAALIGTVIISAIFGILGFIYPNFFEKIHSTLLVALIAIIVVEIILLILGIKQGVTDWLVLAIFCGFVGYDFYHSMSMPKTKLNAVINATSIYLDLINIFVRLLSIFGRK